MKRDLLTAPEAAASRSFLARIEAMIDRCQDSRIVIPAEADTASLRSTPLREVEELLEVCRRLLEEISAHYSALAAQQQSRSEDLEVGLESKAPARISTVAGLAAHQVLECQRRIGEPGEAVNGWALAANLERGWRQALKALLALEGAIRALEDRPAKDRHAFYLQESLQIRRQYSRFRDLVGEMQPEDDALLPRLESVQHTLARMRQEEIFPFLRIDDRRILHSLDKRIKLWRGSGAAPPEGRDLWRDAAGFVRLLNGINRREELLQHDRGILKRLGSMQESGAGARVISAEEGEILRTLLGRDPVLDALLEQQGSLSTRQVIPRLRSLARDLAAAAARRG